MHTEAIHARQDGRLRYLFRVEGDEDDLDAFEAALKADETVATVVRLDEERRTRQYRVEFTERGHPGVVIYEALAASDGYLRDGVGTAEGWWLQLEFPRHASVREFFEACTSNGASCDLRSVHVEETRGDANYETPFGLTEAQHELLVEAAKAGYFDVPKRTSLAKLAEGHGVSTQAISEQLRRGIANLVEHTLTVDEREVRRLESTTSA